MGTALVQLQKITAQWVDGTLKEADLYPARDEIYKAFKVLRDPNNLKKHPPPTQN